MSIKHFVDPNSGEYLGAFIDGAVPDIEGAIEAKTAPSHGLDTYNIKSKSWIPYKETVSEKRFREYSASLGGANDQLDALYKGLEIIIPALIEGRALTAAEAALLTPDKTQPADTPAGWRGKVKDIKERFPKE